MLSILQHALKTADGRRIIITSQVHNKLNMWHYLIASLSSNSANTFEGDPTTPSKLEWINRRVPRGYVRSMPKSKCTMVCVEAPSEIEYSTEITNRR